MPLLDNLRLVYEAMDERQPNFSDLAQRRAAAHDAYRSRVVPLYGPAPDGVSVAELDLPVPGGVRLRSRLYRGDARSEAGAPQPVHLYLHGGGFWSGTPELFDVPCSRVAADAGCAVLSVGYRLAPEHPFPTAVQDAYAALVWTVAHAQSLGLDASRVSIGGVSAGGGLAAAVTLLCRDRMGPELKLQVLEVPAVDLRPEGLRQHDPDGRAFALDELIDSGHRYLTDPARACEPLASPLLAPDLRGLPPALVMTAEYDPMRGAGEAYAARLAADGVPTSLRMWPGQFHGSQRLEVLIPEQAREYHLMVVSALRDAYYAPRGAG